MTHAVFQIIMDIGKLMSWGLTPAVFIGFLVFDYLLAFGLLGIGGIFNKKKIRYILRLRIYNYPALS